MENTIIISNGRRVDCTYAVMRYLLNPEHEGWDVIEGWAGAEDWMCDSWE